MRGEGRITPSSVPSPSPAPGSVGSSDSEFPNQQRLRDVHKKYRIIEGTRRIYHGESEGILRRQEAALANLRNDSKSLRETVDTYYIPNYEAQMSELHEEAAKLTELVEIQGKRLEELEIAYEKSKSDRVELKYRQGGVHAGRDRHRHAFMHIQIVENRIHKAVVDLNIVERQNRLLKRKMEEIREERELFDELRFKIEKELQWKEKEMERCIEMCTQMYDERNDIEERYTDVLDIQGDMDAYKMWEETEGWTVMEPEPIENFMHVALKVCEHRTALSSNFVNLQIDDRKEPLDCTEYFRQWIDLKAMANIQDILKVDNVDDVLKSIQELQQRNGAIIEQMNKLVEEMDTIKTSPKPFDVTIRSAQSDPDAKRKPDIEGILDKISALVKDVEFDDEEYILLINEVKRRIGDIFREAGCAVDDNELTHEKGKARLEEALGQWYTSIDSFVEQLIKEAKSQRK